MLCLILRTTLYYTLYICNITLVLPLSVIITDEIMTELTEPYNQMYHVCENVSTMSYKKIIVQKTHFNFLHVAMLFNYTDFSVC